MIAAAVVQIVNRDGEVISSSCGTLPETSTNAEPKCHFGSVFRGALLADERM
jgi:hypothetical protein